MQRNTISNSLTKTAGIAVTTLLGLVLSLQSAAAADYTLSSDRPDFADDVNSVPPGILQLESGYSYSHVPGEAQSTLGELMLRTGLCSRSELRLGLGSYLSDGASGWGDGSLDLRLRLLRPEDTARPGAFCLTALIGTSLPFGDSDLGARRLQPGVMFTSALTLSGRAALAPFVNYSYQSSPEGQYSEFSGGSSFAVSLGERLTWYAECFGTAVESGYGENTVSAGSGFLWLVRNNLQFDIHGLSALNGATPNYSLGVGMSVFTSIR
ncbi:transporter [bacterium]|nr:transporter [bacterium]